MGTLGVLMILTGFISGFHDAQLAAESYDAEAISLKGKVVSHISGEGLIGVEIEILGSDKTVYTNFDGEFEVTGLDPDKSYSLRLSYVSFSKKIIRGVQSDSDPLIIKLTHSGNSSIQKSHRFQHKT